jgi:eukaryotic-like serine/threonine-protein kinase
MPSAGETIGGKYLLERELGAGGMGVVFEATNVVTEAKVAIKFLNAQAARSEFIANRFTREAKAAGRLRSRYVARVFDADRTASGEPFIVMEFLHGRDLASVLDAGPMPVVRACSLLVQACAGVDEAHRAGIIHRDLKPANLFVATEGNEVVKVLDFGVSKVAESNDGDPTGSSAILGTMKYMSPEHFLEARAVDARADVWALGVILYLALEGRAPFLGDGPSLIAAVLAPSQGAPPMRRPDVPPQLAEIVMRCLVKNRDGRISSVAELAELIAPFAAPAMIADALGEIRGRRHASTPRDGVQAVDVMGATIAGIGPPPQPAGLPNPTVSVMPSGIVRAPVSATAPTSIVGAPSGSMHVSGIPSPMRVPTSYVDPTGAPTSSTQMSAGPPPGVKSNAMLPLVIGGIALTTIVFVFAIWPRNAPSRAEPQPPPPAATQSAPPTPPATVSIILLPAPPPATTIAPPPATTQTIAKPKVSPAPPPAHRTHDAGAPTIPTLL